MEEDEMAGQGSSIEGGWSLNEKREGRDVCGGGALKLGGNKAWSNV